MKDNVLINYDVWWEIAKNSFSVIKDENSRGQRVSFRTGSRTFSACLNVIIQPITEFYEVNIIKKKKISTQIIVSKKKDQ